MNNITAARDISGIAPIGVLKGISPLCVPFCAKPGIADEVKHRAAPDIISLWERLGLVYLIEQPAQAEVHKTHVTVNNFTAQLVFRICSQNHTDRLIERYQPGFVFPEKIRAAGAAAGSALRTRDIRHIEDVFSRNSRYTEEVSRIFRLVFEKETGGIPLQTVCRALAVLLGSTGGGAVFTAQQQMIFQRIATVLSTEYPESTAAKEIASVGAAAVFTEEQRSRILSAANVMGYSSQHEAAQRVLSLVNSGKTRDEIGRVLLTEVRRYGLDERSQHDDIVYSSGNVIQSERSSVELPAERKTGSVVSADGVTYEMAKLLFTDDNTVEIPAAAISSAAISGNSAVRVIAEKISSLKLNERFNKEFSENVTERLSEIVVRHLAEKAVAVSDDGDLRVQTISGAASPAAYRSGEKLVSVTAGSSGRILAKLGGSQQAQIQTVVQNSGQKDQFSENVRSTLKIMKQYSRNEYSRSNGSDNTDTVYAAINSSVVQQVADQHSYSMQELVGKSDESVLRGLAGNFAENFSSSSVNIDVHNTQMALPSERTTEIRSTEFHTEHTTEAAQPGTVLPPERTTEIRSTEHTTETAQPGTVLPPERTAEFRSTEFHTEHTTETAQPGMVLPPERTTEIRSTEQFHTEHTTEAAQPGTVLPAERMTEIRNMEQVHTDTIFTPKNEKKALENSIRSRLDAKTLEVIDRIVAESRGQVKKAEITPEQPVQMTHAEKPAQQPAPAETPREEVLRSVNIVRRNIVNETSSHIRNLMQKAVTADPHPTVKKPFTYRTVDEADNMVMLIPPTEMDRFSAANPYKNKLPPIELKEPPKPQPAQEITTQKTTVNNRPVVTKSTESAIDTLSRDEISRLADKVYERIETKLTRERRRMGL